MALQRLRAQASGAPAHITEPSDVVCISLNGDVPSVTWPLGDGFYSLVGNAWVAVMMYGEALLLSPLLVKVKCLENDTVR